MPLAVAIRQLRISTTIKSAVFLDLPDGGVVFPCLIIPLTLEKLRGPHASVPHNPLLAEPMYLTKYIERMGTGIRDMIDRCRKAGLREPEIRIDAESFVLTIWRNIGKPVAHDKAHDVLTETERKIVLACAGQAKSATQLLEQLGYASRTGNFKKAMARLLDELELIIRTLPDAPHSRNQQYYLTDKGREFLKCL